MRMPKDDNPAKMRENEKAADNVVKISNSSQGRDSFNVRLAQIVGQMAQTLKNTARDNRVAMSEFNDAAKLREHFSVRTEQRALFWIKTGMWSLVASIMLLMVILFMLNSHLSTISTQMSAMNESLGTIAAGLNKLGTKSGQEQQALNESLNAIAKGIDGLSTEARMEQQAMLNTVEAHLKSVNEDIEKLSEVIKSSSGNTARTRIQPRQPSPYPYNQ